MSFAAQETKHRRLTTVILHLSDYFARAIPAWFHPRSFFVVDRRGLGDFGRGTVGAAFQASERLFAMKAGFGHQLPMFMGSCVGLRRVSCSGSVLEAESYFEV